MDGLHQLRRSQRDRRLVSKLSDGIPDVTASITNAAVGKASRKKSAPDDKYIPSAKVSDSAKDGRGSRTKSNSGPRGDSGMRRGAEMPMTREQMATLLRYADAGSKQEFYFRQGRTLHD